MQIALEYWAAGNLFPGSAPSPTLLGQSQSSRRGEGSCPDSSTFVSLCHKLEFTKSIFGGFKDTYCTKKCHNFFHFLCCENSELNWAISTEISLREER